MRRVGAEEAVAAIPPGARVLLPHGCIEPAALYGAIRRSPGHPERPILLMSGLQFGSYPFLGDLGGGDEVRGGLGRGYRYLTWQVGPRIRALMASGRIGFVPLRFRDVPRVIGRAGALRADVVVLQCAPPLGGTINLGISCAFFPAAIAAAKLVIAEVHPDMPRTAGATEIPADAVHLAVDAVAPLATLPRARADEVDRAIVARALDLIPEDAWVQLGVGAVPDATLEALAGVPEVKLHSGMLTDGLLDFLDRGDPARAIVTGEVCGSAALYRRLDREARVSFQPTTRVHDIPFLSTLRRLVSINSAVEVDLWGQVNGETIDGAQMSGVGGSLDFVEGARYSEGGLSVIALRSRARDRSRIVPRLAAGTPVTIPRFAVDVVVTEHGVARLTGLTLDERAEALIAVAAPEWRSELRVHARSEAAARRDG
jgi:4-hydroxybutyrate CoA-transferase